MADSVPNEWWSARKWADLYRSYGLAVIPAVLSPDGKKKHPAGRWQEFQENGVPQAIHEKWFDGASKLMGFLTGKACFDAEHGLFVIDIDIKDGKRGDLTWQAWLTVHNHGMQIETWIARTGSGGLHYYFIAPVSRLPHNTQETIDGIDVRGIGGFIMAPPSPHYIPGTEYEWMDGYAPWETEIAPAPDWLLDTVQSIADVSLSRTNRVTQTDTPDRCEDVFGNTIDGRDKKMADIAYSAMLDAYRECPLKPGLADLQTVIDEAFERYLKHTESRIPKDGRPKAERLEAEGRGMSAFREKMLRHYRTWDTHLAKAARTLPREAAEKKARDERGRAILAQVATWMHEDGHPDAEWIEELLSRPFETPRQEEAAVDAPTAEKRPFGATPFVLPREEDIPRREWLYGRHLIRRFTAATVAPGGVGKSQQAIADALAMATGRTLIRNEPVARLRVWYWNGEDPIDEITRRITATAKHYGITQDDLSGYLFTDSGRDLEIKIAVQDKSGTHIAAPIVDAMIRTITENKIDVVIIDPFVSSHGVTENDNMAIDAVVKTWGRIANITGCAIELIHHVRKTNGDEVTVEDGRGAVALLAAVRSARALNQMSQETAEKLGVDNRRRFFSVTVGKANLYVPDDASVWHELVNVDLANGALGLPGDSVGVVTAWDQPNPLDNVSANDLEACRIALMRDPSRNRRDKQSPAWFGHVICETLGWDAEDKADCHKADQVLSIWLANGAFQVVAEKQSNGRSVKVVKLGVQP